MNVKSCIRFLQSEVFLEAMSSVVLPKRAQYYSDLDMNARLEPRIALGRERMCHVYVTAEGWWSVQFPGEERAWYSLDNFGSDAYLISSHFRRIRNRCEAEGLGVFLNTPPGTHKHCPWCGCPTNVLTLNQRGQYSYTPAFCNAEHKRLYYNYMRRMRRYCEGLPQEAMEYFDEIFPQEQVTWGVFREEDPGVLAEFGMTGRLVYDENRDVLVEKVCAHCGEPFASKSRKARFCSDTCRSAYHNQKRRGKKGEKSEGENGGKPQSEGE